MKVARTTADGNLELAEAPEPAIKTGEALIELVYCGLCGTDLYKLSDTGRAPGEVLGHEVVGRVIESRADSLRPGDRVVAPHHAPCGVCRLCRSGAETMCPSFAENLLDPGGFSERLRLKARAVERTVRKLDDGLADEAAAFVEPAACVLRGIDRAGLVRETQAVVVIGAGSMGLLHLLVLRASFPGARILVAEPDPGRRATARQLGADTVVDARRVHRPGRRSEPPDRRRRRLRHGRRPGRLSTWLCWPRDRAAASCSSRTQPGTPGSSFDINAVFKSERQVIGAYSGSPAEQKRVLDMMHGGALDPSPLVTHRLPLDRAAEAVDLCRRQAALKVLLHP